MRKSVNGFIFQCIKRIAFGKKGIKYKQNFGDLKIPFASNRK